MVKSGTAIIDKTEDLTPTRRNLNQMIEENNTDLEIFSNKPVKSTTKSPQ